MMYGIQQPLPSHAFAIRAFSFWAVKDKKADKNVWRYS
jgi:hypothetical protein